MDVVLYKNFSVHNKLNKNLTTVGTYVGIQLVEPVNDAEISIRMTVPTDTLKWSNVNYMLFDGAYYFVTSVDKNANGNSVVNGEMDLLMTYKSAVNGLLALPERSTSHGSERLDDEMRRLSVDTEYTTVNFSNPIPESKAMGKFILITSQANYRL